MNNLPENKVKIRPEILISLFFVIAALAVYWQVREYEFVSFDDYPYITQNKIVSEGLSLKGIRWAFTTSYFGNWHPLTYISYMTDAQLYGMNAGSYHFTNVLFHILNTLLLFIVFKKMTGDLWQSAFAAALFAFHPLHVESVAWISERKDVLSAFFWILTIWAYYRYSEFPNLGRYCVVVFFFICGLMSKSMFVTLPCILLLLDYWPLKRRGSDKEKLSTWIKLFIEKIPLFALSLTCGIITIISQKSNIQSHTVVIRISNALNSYILYLWKTIYPARLAIFYPYPESFSLWNVIGCALLLIIISFWAFKNLKKHPYLMVGWLWYLITLLPVIGFIQVGSQAMADRYTYLPLIGIFIIVSWGFPRLIANDRLRYIVSACLVLCMTVSWFQIRVWKNNHTLYEHAISVTHNNVVAYRNLGIELSDQGNFKEASVNLAQALELQPENGNLQYLLGFALLQMGKLNEAVYHFSYAVKMNPNDSAAHNDMGIAWVKKGNIEKAMQCFSKAIEISPDDSEIRKNFNKASEMLRLK